MDDNNITYKYLDVDLLNNEDKQEAVSEMKKHINNISFPLIVIDGEIAIKGFQEKELRSTLNV
jgi:glutaredoxin